MNRRKVIRGVSQAGRLAGSLTNCLGARMGFGLLRLLADNNNCPHCKVPFSYDLLNGDELPEICPYCGTAIHMEK